ncbi:MAG: cellulase family glycosylhydrolase [Pseudotabrizicola sp.]|uniref:cellulase family glycosylhydrolase n=1 Tax=Pseudotabrizicola sp. TaxID=2939647 RepID=UPI002730C3DE|nr:cellulase family glycosylhydrolase [Pseudotabrizicola sp.]MDP2079664.1 cellulase family glycosylhydrolase [Pseudotabrizicola sp.]MDZ7574573.1 cellulase family glycosylhydrolase [Pseudotabrizicola sp.]
MLRFRQSHLFISLVFLSFLGGAVFLSALGFAAAMERTTTFRYFDQALSGFSQSPDIVVWRQNSDLDRPVTPQDEYEIGKAVAEAWALYAAALSTGDPQYLPDRFSGPALMRTKHASLTALMNKPQQAQGSSVAMAVLHHNPRPVFHHMDGSVLVLEDRRLTARLGLDAARNLTDLRLSLDDTLTILMNESTGWHVFAHEMQGSTFLAPTQAQPSPARPSVDLPRLAGLNYYPAATPWRQFWPSYDAAIISADLDLVHDLGANTIRIFLPRSDFLDPEAQPTNLLRLEALLSLAHERGLKVMPTLFDLKGDYAQHLWAHDDAMLREVIPVLAASPAVVLVDLKNEPDLDYETHGQGLVQAWLATMAATTRQIAPDLPLTIGFSAAGPSVDLPEQVQGWLDVVSYHDYAPIDGAAERLATTMAKAEGRPVMITEIGTSSWTLLAGLPSSEADQAEKVGARLNALAKADGLLIWTLHDFPNPDAVAVGASPWVRKLQSHFGLYDSDGREKPIGAVSRSFFAKYLSESLDE